jgi:hypothetical protein
MLGKGMLCSKVKRILKVENDQDKVQDIGVP